jgi:hypothetical protein
MSRQTITALLFLALSSCIDSTSIHARAKRLIGQASGNLTVQYPEGKAWAVQYDFNGMEYNWMPYIHNPIIDVFSNELGKPLPKCHSIKRGPHWGGYPVDFVAAYDQWGKILSYTNNMYKGDSLTSYGTYQFSYDFPGRMTMIREVSWGGNVLDTTAVKWLSYNHRNQLVHDSAVFWISDTVSRITVRSYSYYGDGNLQQIACADSFTGYRIVDKTDRMSYDSTGRLRSLHTFVNGQPSAIDSFGYTGNCTYFTWYRHYNYVNPTPKLDLRITKHVGSNGLPDTVVRTIDGIVKVVENYFYDSLGNVIWVHSENFNGQGVLTSTSNFGYVYEDVPDSVKSIIPPTEIAAYPNPVKDELTIAWRNATPGESYGIHLYNIIGQRLLSKGVIWNGQLESVSLEYLPLGCYMLVVEGGTRQQPMVQKIIKQ